MRLEVAVRAQSFLDVTSPAILRVKLDRLEVRHVVTVEEHVPDGRSLLMHLVRMAGKNDTFSDNARGVGRHERARSNEARNWR